MLGFAVFHMKGVDVNDITVLLGDPRLPYRYNLSNRFEQQDYDAVEHLRDALTTLDDYRFRFLDDHSQLWRTLKGERPWLVLNFCNTGYGNDPRRQHHVSAMLDILESPYAGAGPESIVLCHHKFLVYALAADLGVPVPRQVLTKTGDAEACDRAHYPAFIKPNGGDGSIGIDTGAVASDPEEARRYLQTLDVLMPGQDILIQDYLPGPEYSIGVIGNPDTGVTVLPPLEIDFSDLDPGLPPVMTYRSKVDPTSPYWQKVRFVQARSEAASKQMTHHAGRLFERLGCRDYARMDFRADAHGEPRLMDVNAHPMWGVGGMLPTMAGYLGQSYPEFLASIIRAASVRLHPHRQPQGNGGIMRQPTPTEREPAGGTRPRMP